MKPPEPPHLHIEATTFQIDFPDPNECVNPGPYGTILVRVRDLGAGNTSYQATITDLALGSTQGSGGLPREGSSQFFSGQVGVGAVPVTATGNNRRVTVQAFRGSTPGERDSVDFRAQSAPCGSGSGITVVSEARGCQFCDADRPVPAALQLQLDAPVADGTYTGCDQLNQPALLVYCQHADYECCWLSEPIDFGGDPGFWLLQKSDARTWALVLRRGECEVVAYRLTMRAEKDCSFPITLELRGAGGECRDWPRTVTVTAAP